MSLLDDQLADLLLQKNLRLCVAESCTGGLLAGRITDRAGSSAYFDRGFVTYSNNAKHDLLGVPLEILARVGAVSEEVARALLEGIFTHTWADLGAAITGIAGPTGGTADKPVGLVFVAVGLRDKPFKVKKNLFKGTRADIRAQSVDQALEMMINLLES